MALELRQQLKLSQQLVMTQQLQQAISLLQLSRLELIDTVASELIENPFLEEAQAEAVHEEEYIQAKSEDVNKDQVYDKEVANSADWEDYLGELSSSPKVSSHREHEIPEEMTSYESRYATKPTLEAHLMWQLRLSDFTEEQMYIGEHIIGNIGGTGYLCASVEEIAEQAEVEIEQVFPVLDAIQNFDPVGVATHTPKDSLLVQIKKYKYDRDPILVELISTHLEDLENNRYKPLLKKLKIDEETLFEYIQIIKSLDPMPGSGYGESDNFFVSPDVYVYKIEDEFIVVLNEDGMPHLKLSDLNSKAVLDSMNAEQKNYFGEKQKSATWLIKALHQRQRTLYRVVESIVKYQREFFEEGVTKLKPLILKTVADDISMHESTISRITNNKYVATPHGTFEIKFFFNSALNLENGSEVGSESVKAAIKKCIAEEDKKNPLSDERICEILNTELGVEMARRTVAKYRTALDIPSSSKRKNFF